MPDNPPPAYWWAVSLPDGQIFEVEAAYPVIDDGHMLLKDSFHKIVFAAAPGAGCSFRRVELMGLRLRREVEEARAAAEPYPDPPPGTGFWPCGCPVEGAEALRMFAPGSCPHGFPPTVRCHQCSPVTAPGAQAEADAETIRRGAVSASEIRGMRHDLGDDGDTAGTRL
jgi:hypothetical protein